MTSRGKNLGLRNTKKYCNQAIGLRKCPTSPKSYRPRAPRNHRLNVSDLVYKFLADIAALNAERRQRNNARTNFQRVHVRRSRKPDRRPDDKRRSDNQISGCSLALETDDREFGKKLLRSKMRKREKGITDCFPDVDDYVKAVHECKQKAEQYIRKAINFGIDAGFLIPTDHDGHLFRVSSALKRVKNT